MKWFFSIIIIIFFAKPLFSGDLEVEYQIKNKGINDKTEDTVTDLIGYLILLKVSLRQKNE